MQIHKLKIKEEYYEQVVAGKKTFELRKNDRDYQVGDLIQFTKIERVSTGDFVVPFCDKETPTEELFQITYVLKDVPQYGLDKDFCILAIKQVEIRETNKKEQK